MAPCFVYNTSIYTVYGDTAGAASMAGALFFDTGWCVVYTDPCTVSAESTMVHKLYCGIDGIGAYMEITGIYSLRSVRWYGLAG